MPVAPVALDIFEHHDGVVDDQAGREHDGEQRQDVDREAGEIDRGERADQRDRHGQRRDERRAHERRKRKMIATTIAVASRSVTSTSLSAPPMKVASSDVMRM